MANLFTNQLVFFWKMTQIGYKQNNKNYVHALRNSGGNSEPIILTLTGGNIVLSKVTSSTSIPNTYKSHEFDFSDDESWIGLEQGILVVGTGDIRYITTSNPAAGLYLFEVTDTKKVYIECTDDFCLTIYYPETINNQLISTPTPL
jgi:hypothetical protein